MAIGNPGRGLGLLQPLNEGSPIRFGGFIVECWRLGTTWTIGDRAFAKLGTDARFRKSPVTGRYGDGDGINGRWFDRGIVMIKVVLEDGHIDVE
jgi:hypothetical protein